MAKVRLDKLLFERGDFESRAQAAAAIIAGHVHLESGGGQRPLKPGQLVPEDASLSVRGSMPYVSRGGRKLANALAALSVPVAGRRCLDVGASTGGFTDCLLQAGASEVVALDVGYGELNWRLRNDPRVTVLERQNARDLRPDQLPYRPDLITIDVSFISLLKVLPAVIRSAAERFDCLALIKPQFEVGRQRVGSGGVVRQIADRRAAALAVGDGAQAAGLAVLGFAPSSLPGPKGNRETFIWLAEGTRAKSLDDLEPVVAHLEGI